MGPSVPKAGLGVGLSEEDQRSAEASDGFDRVLGGVP